MHLLKGNAVFGGFLFGLAFLLSMGFGSLGFFFIGVFGETISNLIGLSIVLPLMVLAFINIIAGMVRAIGRKLRRRGPASGTKWYREDQHRSQIILLALGFVITLFCGMMVAQFGAPLHTNPWAITAIIIRAFLTVSFIAGLVTYFDLISNGRTMPVELRKALLSFLDGTTSRG